MATDSSVLFPGLRVCKSRPSAGVTLLWARQISCFIPSLLQGHIVPLHVPRVHLQATFSLKKLSPCQSQCCALGRSATAPRAAIQPALT